MFRSELIALGALCVSLSISCPSQSRAGDFFDTVSGRILDRTPAEKWSGLYLGAVTGYGWSRYDATEVFARTPVASASLPVSGLSFSESAFTFGGTIGYNFYASGVVAGVEGDISYGRFVENLGSVTASDVIVPGDALTAAVSAGTSYHATLRGRLGFLVVPDLLVYGTGGLAVARSELEAALVYDDGTAATSASLAKSRFSTGYVLGIGLEDRYSENTSIKLEYLYLTIPGQKFELESGGATIGFETDTTVHMLRSGLNYHF